MRHPEDLLPHDMRFDSFVAEVGDEIRQEVEQIEAEYGDVVSPEHELSSDILEVWRLSGLLAATMKSDTEDVATVQAVMYRSMCFALQIVEEVKSAPLEVVSISSVIPEAEGIAPEDEIHRQTSQYLSQRQHIDDLIGAFMPEIDDTFLCHHHVETAASLMFMLCERQQAEEVLMADSELLTPDDLADKR